MDVALGKVDYYEALGFVDDPMATAHVWYRLLNCGFRLPAGRGNRRDGQLRLAARPGRHEPGLRADRRAARLPALARLAQGRPDLRHQRPAARARRSTAAGVGDELRLSEPATHEVTARVSLRSNVPVDHLEIVGNGEVVREIPLPGDRTRRRRRYRELPVKSERLVPAAGPERPGDRIRCSTCIPTRRPARST